MVHSPISPLGKHAIVKKMGLVCRCKRALEQEIGHIKHLNLR